MEYGVVVVWWLLFVALGLAGLPIAATLLGMLPDRGAGVALPLALVALGVPAYWVGHVSFDGPAVVAGVLFLGGLSIWSAWREPEIDRGRFIEWGVVFTLAFTLIVAIRAVDPSVVPIHPGERLLDYGLLNTHLRADRLPAKDVWLGGERVQYYYGGHMLSAVLAKLTATPGRYAFNLANAGFYAALVAGAYGVAGGIAASRDASFRTGGALGAFFVGVASNLAPVVQVVTVGLPDTLAGPTADALAAVTKLEAPWLLGRIGAGPDSYWSYYWAPSRVIRGTINEFPFFAWLNGDLHAHMVVQPFTVLAIAVSFAYFLTPAERVQRRRLLLFGVLPPVAGWLAVTNTWDFPSAAGLAGIAAFFAPTDPRDLLPGDALGIGDGGDGDAGSRDELGRFAGAALAGVGVLLIGALWVLPYFLFGEGPNGVSGIGFVGTRSGLIEFLLVHGWVLGIFAAYLRVRVAPEAEQPAWKLALVGVIVLLTTVMGAAAFGVVLPLVAFAWYLLRADGDVGFEAALFVAGSGLVLLVELVYLREGASQGRFNTVFKTYTQVWLMWATAAGAALAPIVSPRLPSARSIDRSRLATSLTVVLVLSMSIYGVVALGAHFTNNDASTIDTTRAIQQQHPEVWEATMELSGMADGGQPTIASAPGSPYRWQAAPPSFTGIPTLVTGLHHQRSFHGTEAVDERVVALRAIYTGSPSERATQLRNHDVEYVWVGPWVERRYGASELTVSESAGLEKAFENRAVTIYRVRSSQLPS